MTEPRNADLWKSLAVLALSACLQSAAADAAGVHTVYSFRGGKDGDEPFASLISDGQGNLLGTTSAGGAVCGGDYCGTVFRLDALGNETQLHVFQGGSDGVTPESGLLMDSVGNLYGTTLLGGGAGGCNNGQTNGCGIVFELAPDGTETVLFQFGGGSDGGEPAGTLIQDTSGNLYGTTRAGGAKGDGTVFRLAPDGTETVLHSFTNGSDGGQPVGGVIADRKGNLYGVTSVGGRNVESGVFFRIAPDGTERVLYNFCSLAGCADGAQPSGPLLMRRGIVYGTAAAGGDSNAGVVFAVTLKGVESVVHSFSGSDGYAPAGGVIADGKGNLYGVAYLGGSNDDGTVFALAPDGSETTLYEFHGGTDGENPSTGLFLQNDVLYGTTGLGGAKGLGNVFRIRK